MPSRSLSGSVRTWFSGSKDYSAVNTILQVSDDDNNVNRQAPPQNIEYSMSSTSSIFTIDNATGLIRVLEPALNFERKWTYIVDVTVSDDGMVFNWNTQEGSISTMKSEELSSVGKVEIRLVDVNDPPHCPYMVGSSSYQVSEDALVGSTVAFNDGIYRIEDEDDELGEYCRKVATPIRYLNLKKFREDYLIPHPDFCVV